MHKTIRFMVLALRLTPLFIVASPLGASAQLTRANPEAASGQNVKPLVKAQKAMAVTAHPLATQAAVAVLKKGGSAVDAAITAQLVLNLVEPQSSGIGGGGFLLYWEDCNRKLVSMDGRERAPFDAKPERFLDEKGQPLPFRKAISKRLSVGTPGLIKMLAKAHSQFGRMAWHELFQPAIKLARQGYPLTKRSHKLMAWRGKDSFGPEALKFFFKPDGTPKPAGTILKNPAFAKTLEAIAKHGPAALHIPGFQPADALVRKLWRDNENNVGYRDLAEYKVKMRDNICLPYRSYKVCSMGPPSSGAHVFAQTLGMLNQYDLGKTANAKAMHLIAEAQKLAYADRKRYLADEDFIKIPKGLLDVERYLKPRQKLISKDKSIEKAVPGSPPENQLTKPGADSTNENNGTTHISIMDSAGNVLSMTTSIEAAFGSGLMVNGYLLNNELTDFSFRPVDKKGRPVANRVEGGKRPRSSMSPTIIFDKDGKPFASLGSPGGSRIPLYVIKGVVALIDWKMNAQEAANLINFGSRNKGFEIEKGQASEVFVPDLEAAGQKVSPSSMTSGLHIIVKSKEGFEGGADPRRDGTAGGY